MIGYYVHHHGHGHRHRAAAIASRLRSAVVGFGTMPAPAGWPGEWRELPGDETPCPLDPTANGVLHWAPLDTPGHHERFGILAAALAHGVSVLVVDVSVEVTVLARLFGQRVAVVAMRGDRDDRPHRMAYDIANIIIAPWAEETADPRWPQAWSSKTVYTGSLSRFDDRAPVPTLAAGQRRVLLLWGAGGTDVTDDDVCAAMAATPGWAWTVRDLQHPSPDVWGDMLAADVVVTHGGNNSVAEVAAAARPAVVVAQTRPYDEQLGTVRALRAAGICVALDEWPGADRWAATLDDALSLGGGSWRRWGSGDGAQRAAAAIEALHEEVPGCCPRS